MHTTELRRKRIVARTIPTRWNWYGRREMVAPLKLIGRMRKRVDHIPSLLFFFFYT